MDAQTSALRPTAAQPGAQAPSDQEVMRLMLTALLAVAGETTEGIRPTSTDSYLPPEVVRHVHLAIALGAHDLGYTQQPGAPS